jgi:hypothetical protein
MVDHDYSDSPRDLKDSWAVSKYFLVIGVGIYGVDLNLLTWFDHLTFIFAICKNIESNHDCFTKNSSINDAQLAPKDLRASTTSTIAAPSAPIAPMMKVAIDEPQGFEWTLRGRSWAGPSRRAGDGHGWLSGHRDRSPVPFRTNGRSRKIFETLPKLPPPRSTWIVMPFRSIKRSRMALTTFIGVDREKWRTRAADRERRVESRMRMGNYDLRGGLVLLWRDSGIG